MSVHHSISNKIRNNLIKQRNGNGKNTLSISHWNLGSKLWKNKRNQIQALVDQDNPDVLFISEANLDETTSPHESTIQGYNITLPKTVTRNGTARLVLLTRDSLDFKLRDDLMDDIFSNIWIKISRPGTKGLLICGLYREHQYLSQDTDWSLQPIEQSKRWMNFLKQVETARLSEICHIIGDVNLDFVKWDTPDYSQLQMINDSKNCLEASGFFQLVKDVTRSWPGQVDSLIDHFWTNDPSKVLSVTNKVRAVGDHNVITATIRTKGSDTRRLDTKKRSFKNFDPTVYRQKLERENWTDIYELENVDLAYDFLESKVVGILDELCPLKTIQFRTECKSWLSDNTKDMMKIRDNTRERARESDELDTWKVYRSQRNLVNRLVNLDRKKHYDDLYTRHCDNKDVGAIYKTAKNQAGWKKNSTPTSFNVEGKKITDPQEMANLQSDTFENKTKKLLADLPPPTVDPLSSLQQSLDKWGQKKHNRQKFEFKTITNLDTLKVLNELGNTTSSANDNIDALSLKHGAKILHAPITHIINCSIKTAKFATKWKIGKLLPLHKGKGLDPNDPKSYRPISLLPIMGKLVERILQPQILEFMENSGQLSANHHSYRKNHSTVTSMLQLSDAIFHGCDLNKITTLVTLDQSAAFDVLSHKILTRKLALYNFSENFIEWITSYLSFRSQYVTIGTRNSTFKNVTSGVPQGSVLGPIFYVIYVNELPSIINDANCTNAVHDKTDESELFENNCDKCGQIPTYADDSTVVVTTSTRFQAQEKIDIIIDKVKTFLAANSLSLNLGKTEIVETMVRQKRVSLPGLPPQLTVVKPDGSLKIILAKDYCRLLGANISKDATWSQHLELGERAIVKTLRSTLGTLTHLSKHMSVSCRLLLANGLFLSKLLYLLPMWGGLPAREAKKLQILINKCARMVLGANRKTRTRALMERCGWLYFRELVDYHSLIQMFKLINIGKPVNLRNKLTILHDKRIELTPARLKISRSSFMWRTSRIWNEQPDYILQLDKLSSFKKQLKKHIIDDRQPVTQRRVPAPD